MRRYLLCCLECAGQMKTEPGFGHDRCAYGPCDYCGTLGGGRLYSLDMDDPKTPAPELAERRDRVNATRDALTECVHDLEVVCAELDRHTGGDDTTKGAKKGIHNGLRALRGSAPQEIGASYGRGIPAGVPCERCSARCEPTNGAAAVFLEIWVDTANMDEKAAAALARWDKRVVCATCLQALQAAVRILFVRNDLGVLSLR